MRWSALSFRAWSGRAAALPLLPPAGVPGPAGAADDPPDGAKLRVRSVWISDVHLGTPGCQAAALLDFLKAVDSRHLYLVGDIIDGWQLRRSWYWPQAHNDVVQKLLRKARKGTRVVFVPGNHDEFARKYVGHDFGGIQVVEDCIHTTADGRRLWITHGDYFDGVIQCAKWLAYVGDSAYELTLRLNRHFNSLRARLGLPYWSLSKYLKLKVKRAVSFIGDFEQAVVREAQRRGVHGVVCGHIHHAELREIDGITYANDGDWVESLTALVEHFDGRLEIVDWSRRGSEVDDQPGVDHQRVEGDVGAHRRAAQRRERAAGLGVEEELLHVEEQPQPG
ncbi:MAG TPA: UDP-2,3-diacylglucosamine diphosphatase [Methylibium sp.]|nr:UDP-2,3-diacylglucosamine diphosphatase [Methylibium sp.]